MGILQFSAHPGLKKILLRGANADAWSFALYVHTGLPHVRKSPSVETSVVLRKWDYFLLAVALRTSSALGTHLRAGILVSPSHQVIQGHVLVHRHVAELERKDLASGRRVGKWHKDDPIEATWTHQSLERENRTHSGSRDLIIPPLSSNFFCRGSLGGGVTDILSVHHESTL